MKSAGLIRIFIDESGTAEEISGSGNNRIYTVAAVIIRQKEYVKFKRKLFRLEQIYAPYLNKRELKSRLIRMSNPQSKITDKSLLKETYEFRDFPNGQVIYDKFCQDIKKLIHATKFTIISVSTDKIKKQLYPEKVILLEIIQDLWERIYIHHVVKKVKKSSCFFDDTQALNKVIQKSYEQFLADGTRYVNPSKPKANLAKMVFPVKSHSSKGLFLADYCAYPIKQRFENGNESTFFKEIIKPKLHGSVTDVRTKKLIAMGLKLSLNR